MPPTAHSPTAWPAADAWSDWWRRYRLVLFLVALITLLHYNTAMHIHAAHGIYRRLYYFPIILGAFRGGLRGGLLSALLVCALYIPHAFGAIGFDPAPTLEKVLEMALYLAVGWLSGGLVTRLGKARDAWAHTAGRLQAALEQQTRMEGELVRSARLAAVGRLSAGLAHEIRNPLASIRGSAEVLTDDFPPEHPKGRLLKILLEESGRLNQVLTRFLEFARSEPGEAAAFDLAAEARAVADLLAHRPDTPPLTVEPAAAGPALALANREQIRQVLLNLSLNAAAAAGPDGVVRLVQDADPAACVWRIIDDGPGFSAEAVAQFGTPFFSTRPEGTGLGLATSLRLVEDQGGSLTIDAGHVGGACLVLRLPAAPAA